MNAFKSYAWLVWLGLSIVAVGQEPVRLQHRWEIDPPLGAIWDRAPIQNPMDLNLKRLNSSVSEYQLAEARRIIGSPSLYSEADQATAREAIIKQLEDGAGNRQVRLVLIAAWCALFVDEQASQMWELTKNDPAQRGFVEKVLVEKRSDVAKSDWLTRIAEPHSKAADLLLAIDGLAACGAVEANDSLVGLIRSDATTLPIQLAAARGLGSLKKSGLEDFAGEWLASNRLAKEQLVINLITNHTSDAAEQHIATIFQSQFAPAKVAAYRWYATNRLEKAKELAASLLDHPDNSMRLLAVDVLHRFDDPQSLRLQGNLLSDRNTTIRRTIRDHLIEKSNVQELLPVVDEILTEHLAGEKFEGIEQAILVTAALGEKRRCPQLVTLLDHPRPEVCIRAAWCLRELVDDPEVLDQIVKHCQRWTDLLLTPDLAQPVEDADIFRLSFLFEALGRNAYRPADSMLRWYVPKNTQRMRPTTRIAAIWAMGQIWKGRQDSGLEKELASRILDMSTTDPEEDTVRYTSAIALGLMKNKASIAPLESAAFEPPHPVGLAIEWALEQIGPE